MDIYGIILPARISGPCNGLMTCPGWTSRPSDSWTRLHQPADVVQLMDGWHFWIVTLAIIVLTLCNIGFIMEMSHWGLYSWISCLCLFAFVHLDMDIIVRHGSFGQRFKHNDSTWTRNSKLNHLREAGKEAQYKNTIQDIKNSNHILQQARD